MLHGDLSRLRRGGSSSSGRASSFHGSWRGSSRGGWRQGRDRVIKKADEEIQLGRLIAEFTAEGVVTSAVSAAEARITNCAYAASYSLNDEKPLHVIVPGMISYDAKSNGLFGTLIGINQVNLLVGSLSRYLADFPVIKVTTYAIRMVHASLITPSNQPFKHCLP